MYYNHCVNIYTIASSSAVLSEKACEILSSMAELEPIVENFDIKIYTPQKPTSNQVLRNLCFAKLVMTEIHQTKILATYRMIKKLESQIRNLRETLKY